MSVINSFVIAFAMYSKIPMPNVEWTSKNKKYVICFFPFVGVVIGALALGWFYICQRSEIGSILFGAIMAVIPLIITGGIHVDGYMDTMDALHSYKEKEEKLSILKDPHIGAFSVITLIGYYLIYVGVISELHSIDSIWILALSYVLSRVLSGLGVVYFPSAKNNGMLYDFSSSAHKKIVRVVLIIMLISCYGLMIWIHLYMGLAVMLGSILMFIYYRYKSLKEFGGITGDLSGWFLMLVELVSVILITVVEIVIPYPLNPIILH